MELSFAKLHGLGNDFVFIDDRDCALDLTDEQVSYLCDRHFGIGADGVTAPQAIGYKEIVEALDGNITLEEAVQAIKTATRRYGKRQRTWFRRDKRIRWVNADVGDAEAVAAEILSQLETLDAYHG